MLLLLLSILYLGLFDTKDDELVGIKDVLFYVAFILFLIFCCNYNNFYIGIYSFTPNEVGSILDEAYFYF